MGNVVTQVNNDGQNSQLFLGNYHNVGSTTTNFTGATVNFSGNNQTVAFTGTGQTVFFGGTGVTSNVIYYNQPVFNRGAVFPDGTSVLINNSPLISNGKLNASFLPDNSNLSATGISVGSGTGAFTVNSSGNVIANNITGTSGLYGTHYGSHILSTGQSITGTGSINIIGGITGTSGNITGILNAGTLNATNWQTNGTPGINTANSSIVGGGFLINNTSFGMNNSGTITASSANISGGITGSTGFYSDLRSTNRAYVGSYTDNQIINTPGVFNIRNPDGRNTHFGYSDGKNYIRGPTQIDDTITASTATFTGLSTSTSKSATGSPVGGLAINGLNNWIIAENSSGHLCFYNTKSGLTNATTVPLACLGATGFLLQGSG